MRNAYKKLISARSYTAVTNILNTDGTRRKFVLSYTKDANEQVLLRGDTVSYPPNATEPDPKLSRVEISNSQGNWELRGNDLIQDVAFLREDGAVPETSVKMHRADLEMATQALDPKRHYSERIEIRDNHASTIISETIADAPGFIIDYVIDLASGNLSEMYFSGPTMTCETRYQTNPSLAPSLFEIPDSKLVLPTQDIESDAATISDHVK